MNSKVTSEVVVETSRMKMVEEATVKGHMRSYVYRVYKKHDWWNLVGILTSGGLWYELHYSPDRRIAMKKYYEDV